MGIRETLKNLQTEEMRTKLRLSKDENATPDQIEMNDVRLQSFRAVSAAILAQETGGKTRKELNEQGIIQVMRGLAKRRLETAEEYEAVHQYDRASRESNEAHAILSLLPKQMDEDETRALVAELIAETGAEGPKGIGAVMKAIKQRDDVNAGMASKIARELLA